MQHQHMPNAKSHTGPYCTTNTVTDCYAERSTDTDANLEPYTVADGQPHARLHNGHYGSRGSSQTGTLDRRRLRLRSMGTTHRHTARTKDARSNT